MVSFWVADRWVARQTGSGKSYLRPRGECVCPVSVDIVPSLSRSHSCRSAVMPYRRPGGNIPGRRVMGMSGLGWMTAVSIHGSLAQEHASSALPPVCSPTLKMGRCPCATIVGVWTSTRKVWSAINRPMKWYDSSEGVSMGDGYTGNMLSMLLESEQIASMSIPMTVVVNGATPIIPVQSGGKGGGFSPLNSFHRSRYAPDIFCGCTCLPAVVWQSPLHHGCRSRTNIFRG